mmetsp:Transcript_48664/g.104008  ORF Transcript_48664/g.104008 Transcript_48664/m.104008 type:complete len:83 (+) Transcript_48664:136-384(+)
MVEESMQPICPDVTMGASTFPAALTLFLSNEWILIYYLYAHALVWAVVSRRATAKVARTYTQAMGATANAWTELNDEKATMK